jgi:hypothetical protein
MASTVINGPGTPAIRRSAPVNLGTLTAVTQVVQFSIMTPNASPNGNDLLNIVSTGAITTGVVVLEASLDAGTTWFGVPSGSQSVAFTITTLNSDTAVSAAGSFNISGLQGALFRAGVTGTITVNPSIWALLG